MVGGTEGRMEREGRMDRRGHFVELCHHDVCLAFARETYVFWMFFPKALRRVLPENPLNTDISTLTLEH